MWHILPYTKTTVPAALTGIHTKDDTKFFNGAGAVHCKTSYKEILHVTFNGVRTSWTVSSTEQM